MITDQMVTVCEIMGIPLVDHIIVGGDNCEYFSFREKDVLPMKRIKLQDNYMEFDMSAAVVAEDHVIPKPRHHR